MAGRPSSTEAARALQALLAAALSNGVLSSPVAESPAAFEGQGEASEVAQRDLLRAFGVSPRLLRAPPLASGSGRPAASSPLAQELLDPALSTPVAYPQPSLAPPSPVGPRPSSSSYKSVPTRSRRVPRSPSGEPPEEDREAVIFRDYFDFPSSDEDDLDFQPLSEGDMVWGANDLAAPGPSIVGQEDDEDDEDEDEEEEEEEEEEDDEDDEDDEDAEQEAQRTPGAAVSYGNMLAQLGPAMAYASTSAAHSSPIITYTEATSSQPRARPQSHKRAHPLSAPAPAQDPPSPSTSATSTTSSNKRARQDSVSTLDKASQKRGPKTRYSKEENALRVRERNKLKAIERRQEAKDKITNDTSRLQFLERENVDLLRRIVDLERQLLNHEATASSGRRKGRSAPARQAAARSSTASKSTLDFTAAVAGMSPAAVEGFLKLFESASRKQTGE